MTVKRLIELKTSSVNYTAEEVQATLDELHPLAQKLLGSKLINFSTATIRC